jgi:hypothetical protein
MVHNLPKNPPIRAGSFRYGNRGETVRRFQVSQLALAIGLLLLAGSAQADTIITAVINNASFGNGPIQSWNLDLTTGTATAGGSFIPTGAVPGGVNGASPNGRGIAVTNTQFYYTELSGGGFGPTLNIETGPYNGGAGGADNGSIANPIPGQGVADLHFGTGVSGGDLFALAGYNTVGPEVFEFDPSNGNILLAPVTIATSPSADGFTILPNGNYLINRGDATNSYDQYDPVTGARIAGTNITAGGCGDATGVDTDGAHLFFVCNFNSIAETDMSGTLIQKFTLPGTFGTGEELSLVENFSPPAPNSAVPEPASILLLGTAGCFVTWRLRKKIG